MWTSDAPCRNTSILLISHYSVELFSAAPTGVRPSRPHRPGGGGPSRALNETQRLVLNCSSSRGGGGSAGSKDQRQAPRWHRKPQRSIPPHSPSLVCWGSHLEGMWAKVNCFTRREGERPTTLSGEGTHVSEEAAADHAQAPQCSRAPPLH